jgi:hypothetical protein
MNEITVFDIKEEAIVLNKSQKQLEYEELEATAAIDKHHYRTLLELDEFLERKEKPSSNITSILLKWILRYCMPITTTEPKQFSIALQNETVLYGIVDGKNAAIPTGVQFHAIGIKIPALFVRHYNRYALNNLDHISHEQISNTGHYGLYDFQTEKYTQQRSGFTHPGYPHIGENTIHFVNDVQVNDVLKKLSDYISFIESFYNINYPAIRYDLIQPELLESGKKWYIVNGRVVDKEIAEALFNISSKSSVSKTTKQNGQDKSQKQVTSIKDFSLPLLHILDKVQPGKFGKAFYFDILFALDRNGLLHAYHIGDKIGMDDTIFKTEYEQKRAQLEYNKVFGRQVQEAHAYYNQQARRKIIALNKYQTADLDSLDAKQRKVVELEYKKVTASLDESTNDTQRLFYRLRKTFADANAERLRLAIKDVEKAVSKKDLEGDKILASGDCPHVYAYAKQLSDDFGKPWLGSNLKDLMLKRFSLPHDTSGHFCKICGEKLLDSDNVGDVTFLGLPGNIGMSAHEDDALQTMIWKEAMYIVSTNVRFTEPMPIKPLVNSLASGLRGVVASEEGKLFRSKTSSADTIRDTLNLYAAIYIYAALCAVMINNPGKLMFARDRPEDSSEKERKLEAIERKKEYLANKAREEKGKSKAVTVNPASEKITSEYMDDADVSDNESVEMVESDNAPIQEPTPAVAVAAGKRRRKFGSGKSKHSNKHSNKHRYVVGGKMIATDNTKKASAQIIKNALILLIISKESIITRTKNINIPIIRNMFGTAFKWASDHAKPIHFDREVDSQLHQDPFIGDPFYTYNHYARRLAYFANGGFAPGINDVFNLLGRHRNTIISEWKENDVDLYSTAPLPQKWDKLKVVDADPAWQKFFDEYTYQSFVSMYEFMHDRVYQNSYVPRHVQVSDYLEKFNHLLRDEFIVKQHRAKQNLRPNFSFGVVPDIMWKLNKFDPNKLDLAQHFCPSGENHKVGSYIYLDPKSKQVELSKKDITEWLDKKDTEKLAYFESLELVNERCALCKNTIRDGKSSNKSLKALSNMFKAIDDVLAFYQYYETRCPKGNLHDIIDNKCGKCGFHSDYGKKAEIEYYNKYVAGFRKIQLEQQDLTIKSLESIKDVGTIEELKYTSKPKEYQYSLKKTSEWSQLTGTKYNIIVNIGLSEGVKFIDIEQAKINPSKEPHSYKTRALKFKGYIYGVLRDYTLFLNHNNVVELPLPLKEIMQSQKKLELNGMPMFDEFTSLDDSYKYVLSPENYCNFLQEYLAGILVSISAFPVGKQLAMYFTKNITSKEMNLSRAEPIFLKQDITALENGSNSELSGEDDWAGRNATASEASNDEFAEEKEVETYDNDIDNEGFDVENADDIWENE